MRRVDAHRLERDEQLVQLPRDAAGPFGLVHEHDLALVVALALDGAAREADEHGERREHFLLVVVEQAQRRVLDAGEEPLHGLAQLGAHRGRVDAAQRELRHVGFLAGLEP